MLPTHRIKCQYLKFLQKRTISTARLATLYPPPNGTQERDKDLFCVEASKQLAQENPTMASTLLELFESFLPGQIEQLREPCWIKLSRNGGMPCRDTKLF